MKIEKILENTRILFLKNEKRTKNRYIFSKDFGIFRLFLILKIGILLWEIFDFRIKIGTRKTRKRKKNKENERKSKVKIPIFHALLF